MISHSSRQIRERYIYAMEVSWLNDLSAFLYVYAMGRISLSTCSTCEILYNNFSHTRFPRKKASKPIKIRGFTRLQVLDWSVYPEGYPSALTLLVQNIQNIKGEQPYFLSYSKLETSSPPLAFRNLLDYSAGANCNSLALQES